MGGRARARAASLGCCHRPGGTPDHSENRGVASRYLEVAQHSGVFDQHRLVQDGQHPSVRSERVIHTELVQAWLAAQAFGQFAHLEQGAAFGRGHHLHALDPDTGGGLPVGDVDQVDQMLALLDAKKAGLAA